MRIQGFSRDIWDYLNEIPYMPSRQDRDQLVQMADEQPRQAKRIQIWNYFFRLNPNDVGKPQMREIAMLTQRREIELAENSARTIRMLWLATIPVLVGLGLTYFLASQDNQTLRFSGPFVVALGVSLLIIIGVLYSRTRNRIQSIYQEMIDELQKSVKALRSKVPEPPSDEQIHRWLKEDIMWLSKEALKRTGLEKRKIDLEGVDNPFYIMGPAELQDRKQIPPPFVENPDLKKHIKAFIPAFLPDGRFADFYGVYYVEFIIVANDMLGNYGCFFDFITGKIYGEHTSEIYYDDVALLTTRDEYRRVQMDWFQTQEVIQVPTFGMALTSGDDIKVSFASVEYVNKLIKLKLGHSPISDEEWGSNPEPGAKKAIKALRKYLRDHKGLPEDNKTS